MRLPLAYGACQIATVWIQRLFFLTEDECIILLFPYVSLAFGTCYDRMKVQMKYDVEIVKRWFRDRRHAEVGKAIRARGSLIEFDDSMELFQKRGACLVTNQVDDDYKVGEIRKSEICKEQLVVPWECMILVRCLTASLEVEHNLSLESGAPSKHVELKF